MVIKSKKINIVFNIVFSILLVSILFLFYFWFSTFNKKQVESYYEEIYDIKTYSQSFFEEHKENGFKEVELMKFENDIFDKWNYSIDLKTNLNDANKKENPYFSLDLYTQNQYGEKIKFKTFFFE